MAIEKILRIGLTDVRLTFECTGCRAVSATLERSCPSCGETWASPDDQAAQAAGMVRRGIEFLTSRDAELKFALRLEVLAP